MIVTEHRAMSAEEKAVNQRWDRIQLWGNTFFLGVGALSLLARFHASRQILALLSSTGILVVTFSAKAWCEHLVKNITYKHADDALISRCQQIGQHFGVRFDS